MRRWFPLLIALVGAGWLAHVATTPVAPRAADVAATGFSAGRAMADDREIARAPHPTGSADNARVRAWLVGRLTQLGLNVRTRSTPMSPAGARELRKWSGDATPRPVVDIVATLPGRNRAAPAVALMAHYDSVWGSPGGSDDGAGVASALETVRALRMAGPYDRDLIVLFTDGEELGLEGGKAFFASDPDRGHIGAIINLETRGGGGKPAMFETGAGNGGMMRLFGGAVRHPSATSLSVLVYRMLPNSTDFTPAKALGIAGFNFAFIGRPAMYHSPLATAASLDQGALQDMGDQALDLTRALLTTSALPGRSLDLVFFDVFGQGLIVYPAAFGWLVIGGAAALYTFTAWRVRANARDIGRGILATIALIVASGILLYLGNLLSGADGKTNYYDRLAAIPRLEVQALLIAILAFAGVIALFRRRDEPTAVVVGTAVPLLLVGLVLQAAAPTAAFVVAWPLLLGGLAAAMSATFGRVAGATASVIAAALGAGYLVGLSFSLMEAVGPSLPSTVALPTALIGTLLWPLTPTPHRRGAVIAIVLLVLAASGVALSIRLSPLAPSLPLYSLRE
jgi:hypothetical protein